MTIEKAREILRERLTEAEINILRGGARRTNDEYWRPREMAEALKVALFAVEGIMRP